MNTFLKLLVAAALLLGISIATTEYVAYRVEKEARREAFNRALKDLSKDFRDSRR